MISAGIDIGSRSIEIVIVDNGIIRETRKTDTGFDPIGQARKLIDGLKYDAILATGYGRNLFEIEQDAATITEIKAHARGAAYFFPQALPVLDIGGQDSKVIKLNTSGKVVRFEMNDRCAAGTGKFLEIMAKTLGFSIETFGENAMAAKKDLNISSMCTVFAESEVTSLVAKGENPDEIARGLHLAVVKRAASMLRRVSPDGPVVFTGGVANNPFIVKFLALETQREILIPQNPEMNGAVGAAFLATENKRK
ncbi:MAG: 3-hydroxyacyl-ACP dehydratase [Proteobacteria bacterium]|nr:3-hydroxyacyl-ACP dehydratase [Pseudomonadota bacterium]MBU1585093.1 3-hydroxyacyl-ACP dehydratase [Pseudomonadota bacterium]